LTMPPFPATLFSSRDKPELHRLSETNLRGNRVKFQKVKKLSALAEHLLLKLELFPYNPSVFSCLDNLARRCLPARMGTWRPSPG
jgi:hypothetical protein